MWQGPVLGRRRHSPASADCVGLPLVVPGRYEIIQRVQCILVLNCISYCLMKTYLSHGQAKGNLYSLKVCKT